MLPSLFFILSSLFLCFICSFSLFFFSPHPFLLLSLFKMLPSLFFILSSLFLCFICSFSLFTSPLTRFCSRHFLLLPLLFCHTAYLFSPTLVFFPVPALKILLFLTRVVVCRGYGSLRLMQLCWRESYGRSSSSNIFSPGRGAHRQQIHHQHCNYFSDTLP